MLSPLSPLSTGPTPDSALGPTRKMGAMIFLWQGAAFRKRTDALRHGRAEIGGSSQERKPKEARSGQPEGRSARQRRKPKPNPLSFEGPAEPEAPGRKEPRKDTKKLRFVGVR